MDHRCLYGHRVPATFAFAIQNRLCPMCGAPTVTVTGYQVARKLTTDANLDAVQAFQVIKVIESEWVLQPSESRSTATATTTPEAEEPPAPAAATPVMTVSVQPPTIAMEEVVVEEDAAVDVEEIISLPEAKAIKPLTMPAPAMVAVNPSPVNITARTSKPAAPPKSAFDSAEEDFFKG